MRLVLALTALGVTVLTGCGVDLESSPQVVSIPPLTAVTSEPSADSTGVGVSLWFLQDGRLVPVERAATAADPATALALLAEGPAPEEVAAGLSTALPPQPLDVVEPDVDDATTVLTVAVTPALTGVAGEQQLRAVAQVVWTATAFDGVGAVRFTRDGDPLEVPTDEGLTDAPVDREDYASVAPAAGGTPDAAAPAASSPAARTSPAGRRPASRARARP